jgi:hypothetical protein
MLQQVGRGMKRFYGICPAAFSAEANTFIVYASTVKHLDFSQKQKDFTISNPDIIINCIFA